MCVVFQMAHVVEGTEQPLPDAKAFIRDELMVHELKTTSGYFAPKNGLFSWYVSGLNFQVGHHLFPNVCHIHYKKYITDRSTYYKGIRIQLQSKTYIGSCVSFLYTHVENNRATRLISCYNTTRPENYCVINYMPGCERYRNAFYSFPG